MTWQVVARRDLREFRADNTFRYFGTFLALVGAAVGYFATNGSSGGPISPVLAPVFLLAVPLVAVTLAHETIPQRVASGRVRLTLSLPHSRAAFVAGAGVAAFAATMLVVGVGVLAAIAVAVPRGGAVAPLGLLGLLAAGSLLAAAFVGATLAVTARSGSPTRATASAYGFFLVAYLWPAFVAAGTVLLGGTLRVAVSPGTRTAVIHGSPIYAFQAATAEFGALGAAGGVPAWAGVLVLLAWAAGGYALAARRFGARDL